MHFNTETTGRRSLKPFLVELRRRLADFIDHRFHERQFLVRGRGNMIAVTITKFEQLCAVSVVAGLILWSAIATISFALTGHGLVRAAMAENSLQYAASRAQATLNSVESNSQAIMAQMQAKTATAQAERDQAVAQANMAVAADHAQVDDLTRQVQTSINSVQAIIKSTGLDPDHLVIAPPPQKVPANLTASGPTRSVAPPNDDSNRTELLNAVGKLQSLNAVLQHLPVISPVTDVSITSPFGYRASPFTGAREFHVGIDLRGAIGTPIYATAPGVVIFAGVSTGYGNLIVIDHGYGLTTRYSHLEKIQVQVGTVVSLHQKIGLLGNTGWSTGPHLLYETRFEGEPLDPLHFIKVYR